MYVYSKDWVLVNTVLWAVCRNTNTTVLGWVVRSAGAREHHGEHIAEELHSAGVYALGHVAGKVLLTAGRRLTHRILAGSPSCVWSTPTFPAGPPSPFPSLLPSSVTFFTLLPCYKSLGCNDYGVSQYVPELVPIKTYVVSAKQLFIQPGGKERFYPLAKAITNNYIIASVRQVILLQLLYCTWKFSPNNSNIDLYRNKRRICLILEL